MKKLKLSHKIFNSLFCGSQHNLRYFFLQTVNDDSTPAADNDDFGDHIK